MQENDPKDATIAALAAAIRRAVEVVRWVEDRLPSYWSFDSNQCHTHSWHEREDFMSEFRRLAAVLKENA